MLPRLNTPKIYVKAKRRALEHNQKKCVIESIYDFKPVNFDLNEENLLNGLILGNCYIPKEILCLIFGYLNAKDLLKTAEVCKNWHLIARSHRPWMLKYERFYKRKPKKLPWFVYYTLFAKNFFDVNLLKNGDASNGLKNWDMNHSHPGYLIERVQNNFHQLPDHITHCFTTYSHRNVTSCFKSQKVHLTKGIFTDVILDYYKPHIYVSEFASSCPDYNAAYELRAYVLTTIWQKPEEHKVGHRFSMDNENQGNWIKKEILIEDYPENTRKLEFYHGSYDYNKDYTGHYGTIMTGGQVKILFDSIEPKTYDKFIINDD